MKEQEPSDVLCCHGRHFSCLECAADYIEELKPKQIQPAPEPDETQALRASTVDPWIMLHKAANTHAGTIGVDRAIDQCQLEVERQHRAALAAVEQETVQHAADHWFLQGGKMTFGPLTSVPKNADDLIAEILAVSQTTLATVEAERDVLKAENDHLNKMRTHCERCGADYMATGIEAGCPCLLAAELSTLRASLTHQAQALEKLAKRWADEGAYARPDAHGQGQAIALIRCARELRAAIAAPQETTP